MLQEFQSLKESITKLRKIHGGSEEHYLLKINLFTGLYSFSVTNVLEVKDVQLFVISAAIEQCLIKAQAKDWRANFLLAPEFEKMREAINSHSLDVSLYECSLSSLYIMTDVRMMFPVPITRFVETDDSVSEASEGLAAWFSNWYVNLPMRLTPDMAAYASIFLSNSPHSFNFRDRSVMDIQTELKAFCKTVIEDARKGKSNAN